MIEMKLCRTDNLPGFFWYSKKVAVDRKMTPAQIVKYKGAVRFSHSIRFLRRAQCPNATSQKYVEWLKRRGLTQGCAFWGPRYYCSTVLVIYPQNQKCDSYGKFQPKLKTINISWTVGDMKKMSRGRKNKFGPNKSTGDFISGLRRPLRWPLVSETAIQSFPVC
jgi:hypothetical protein